MCTGAAMSGDEEFRIRPGRVRSRGAQRARPFVAHALAAAQKAGGSASRGGSKGSKRSRFGKGQRASIQANRFITAGSRGAVVKARVVRHSGRAASLGVHLTYLRREGVTRDGEPHGQKARLFGQQTENADAGAFGERCAGDRHHFRFIVSPDDASQMTDLRGFTRDLMGQAERDLETKLDWVAVDHWNTGHPHTVTGATWLDRQAIAREPATLGGGFGAEVQDAIEKRNDHLAGQGLAERRAGRIVFARNLMDTLRRRELDAVGERLAAETGLPLRTSKDGEYITGRYRQRLSLASGRFAMVDNGLGFQLVPWSPSMEKHLGQQVSGIARSSGVDWSFGRKRGLGI